jgi:hypothetical protein
MTGLFSSILARDRRFVTSFFKLAKSVVAEAGRAIKTKSHPGLIVVKRAISLSNRFTLFLTTALPIFLLTESPHLEKESPLLQAFSISKLLTHELLFA